MLIPSGSICEKGGRNLSDSPRKSPGVRESANGPDTHSPAIKLPSTKPQSSQPSRSRKGVSKKVGLKQIAQQAGVSLSSVSMALADHPDMNEQTKLRIRQISRQMGYRRPRKTAEVQNKKITRFGFVLLGSQLEDEVHLGLFNALTAAAHAAGVRLEVRALSDLSSPQAVIDDVFTFAAHLDGLVLSGYVDGPLLAELGNAGIAHVSIGHTMVDIASIEASCCQVVTCDEVAMAMLATRSLVNAGHQRIAFVCERIPRGLWNERWLRGYHATLIEQGIKLDPNLVQITGKPLTGAQPAVDRLMQLHDKPTAYISPDIRIAASLVKALAGYGVTLPQTDMVISGHERLLQHHKMQGWPWIGFDLTTIAAVAIRQLRHLHNEPMPCSSEVYIPYLAHHLPGRDPADKTY